MNVLPIDLSNWSVYYQGGLRYCRSLLDLVEKTHHQMIADAAQFTPDEEMGAVFNDADYHRQVHVRLIVVASYHHLEGVLKRLSGRKKGGFQKLLDEFDSDLTALTGYDSADLLRLLTNNIKHEGGVTMAAIKPELLSRLPSGGQEADIPVPSPGTDDICVGDVRHLLDMAGTWLEGIRTTSEA